MTKTRKPRRPKLLTRRELAAALGVFIGTVTRWEADGCPVAKKSARGYPTLFDREAVEAWRAMASARPQNQTLSLEHERARLACAQAEKTERENALRAGQLIDCETVVREGQHYTAGWAAQVRALPTRLVQAGIITAEQRRDVAAVCREMLTEIASWKTAADIEAVLAQELAS